MNLGDNVGSHQSPMDSMCSRYPTIDSSEYNQNAWSVFPKLSWALIAATAWGEKEHRDTLVEKCVKIDWCRDGYLQRDKKNHATKYS